MFLPAREIKRKSDALEELYYRIARVAMANGGTSTRVVVRVEYLGATAAAPHAEPAPAIHVSMPDGFQVVFVPTNPLSIGQVLAVRANRNHKGCRKSDRNFNLGATGWRMGSLMLLDSEIRGCLMPDGPPSMYASRLSL
jgi:hypothetical protein